MSIDIGGNHAVQPYYDTRNDELLIAGEPLSVIAKRVDSTPFYAYDHTVIDRKLAELRAALPREVRIHYAIKANPMAEVVRYISDRTDGLDVASAGELTVALATQREPSTISIAGPGKSELELAAAAKAGITINVESDRELTILSRIAMEDACKPRVAIRVNPNFELKSSGMKMSGGPKPFGIDAERVPEVLQALKKLPLEFVGLHIFSGSQNLQSAAIIDAQTQAFELACSLAPHAPASIRELNLGGGFGIPYFPGARHLDIQPIGAHLATLVTRSERELNGCQLTLELGRYIVGEAGTYICRVIDRKLSRGQVFLITDGGLHHHLSASGNFGQVIRKNYPVIVGNRVVGTQREIVNVVGPLCTPLDILADKMELARANVGDFIVVMQSGAYGLTASPLRFLDRPLPGEFFL